MSALYGYQSVAIAEVRARISEGHRRVLLVSPTGSGKTAMGVAMVDGAVALGHRVLWIAHRRELVSQASDRLDRVGCTNHGVILADHDRTNPGAPVQVASVQTLTARAVRPEAKLIVWDECHHCAAETYVAIREAYPNAFHIGLTATPERGDGAALGDAFDVIVPAASIGTLTGLGYLVPCAVVAPANLGKDLAKDPLTAWEQHAPGRPTIVFAANIGHSLDIVAAFRAAGVKADHVDGDTPTAEREVILGRFIRGETMVLSNVHVLTEGFDAPRAEVCLLARGAGSASTYLQMVGRVLRTHTGKTDALLIDLKGVVHQHGMPEEERIYSLTGKAIRRNDVEALRQCPMCGGVAAPAPVCGRCAFEFPAPEAPSIVEREIGRILRPTATLEEKQSTFDRLSRTARERGYKAGWLAHRFRATYGHWPVGLRERGVAA